MNSKKFGFVLILVSSLAGAAAPSGQEVASNIESLDWQKGPAAAPIGAKAVLNVNRDIVYINESNSRKFLELTGNLPSNGYYIIFNTKDSWWAGFSFSESGYIKDGETIDPNVILKRLKDGDAATNEERRKRGFAELYTDGWYKPPHYDPMTKRLEWGVRLRSGNEFTANYTIRLLGRTGVTSATLVSSPEVLDQNVQSFKAVLPGFEYKSGEQYSEFKQGDRVAEFGLAALIAGGAAAVATKKGLWGVIGAFLAASWKIAAGVLIAAGAGVKKLLSRNKDA